MCVYSSILIYRGPDYDWDLSSDWCLKYMIVCHRRGRGRRGRGIGRQTGELPDNNRIQVSFASPTTVSTIAYK